MAKELEEGAEKITPRTVHSETPAKVTSRISGTSELIKTLGSLGIEESTNEETILDIKVHNPLKRITQLLQDLKKHQTTTVSLRFTIPLIALPIVLFVAFQIGRAQTLCAQTFTTQAGTIQVLQVKVPRTAPTALSLVLSFFPSVPQPTADLVDQERAILLLPTSEVVHIIHPRSVDVVPFVGQSVLLTGNYSACTRSITLDHQQNLSEAAP